MYSLGFITQKTPAIFKPRGVQPIEDGFLRNIFNVAIQKDTYVAELSRIKENIESYFNDLYEDDPVQSPILWAILFKSCEAFESIYSRWPGDFQGAAVLNEEDALQADVKILWEIVEGIASEYRSTADGRPSVGTDVSCDITLKHCQEMVRFGSAVMHSIASVMGGVASQVLIIYCKDVSLIFC